MDDRIQIRAHASVWMDEIEFLIEQGDSVAVNIEMEKRIKGKVYYPQLRIPMESGQRLMDDLWHAGLRPTEGTGSAGSLRATENHLKDMRKIVFKELEIDELEESRSK